MSPTKLEECARAFNNTMTPTEIVRAVIRCLMEPDERTLEAGRDCDTQDGNAPAGAHFLAMLQSVLDGKE